MDFLLFVSHTNKNDLFTKVLEFIVAYGLYIHVHILPFDDISLLDQVLEKRFNKDNKMAFIRYVEN